MKHLHPARAFTLVEVLVVVSIISVLISILTPSLSQAREEARLVKCQTQQKQIGHGFELYAASNEDRRFWPYPADGTPATKYWHRDFLFPVLYPGEPTDAPDVFEHTIFQCPSAQFATNSTDPLDISYGMNVSINTEGLTIDEGLSQYVSASDFKAPSSTAVTMDNATPLAWFRDPTTFEAIAKRHNGVAMIGYADTSVRRRAIEDLYFNDDPALDDNDVRYDEFWLGK